MDFPEDFGNPQLGPDFHELLVPPPVNWWPLAPGWYVLLVALLLSVIWLVSKHKAQTAQNRYRKEGLKAIDALAESHRSERLTELPVILKTTALAVYPRSEVASLTGKDLVDFLNSKTDTPLFSQRELVVLQKSYGPPDSAEEDDLLSLERAIRGWIGQHRV